MARIKTTRFFSLKGARKSKIKLSDKQGRGHGARDLGQEDVGVKTADEPVGQRKKIKRKSRSSGPPK